MHVFYIKNIEKDLAYLDQSDSRHCFRVLRMKPGDRIFLTDGNGSLYEGEIKDSDSGLVMVNIIREQKEFRKREYFLHIAIAPTKSLDRFEWFLEKATEIGVDEITPLLCDHSERRNIKNERLQKILISSMKQSVQAYIPVLNTLTGFRRFIDNCKEEYKYIAHCKNDENIHLIRSENPAGRFTVLIGPEGDFSHDEINSAKEKNFLSVSLGQSRLRTETAGVVVCQVISDRHALKSG